jgi:hypothetical protein
MVPSMMLAGGLIRLLLLLLLLLLLQLMVVVVVVVLAACAVLLGQHISMLHITPAPPMQPDKGNSNRCPRQRPGVLLPCPAVPPPASSPEPHSSASATTLSSRLSPAYLATCRGEEGKEWSVGQ